MTSRETLSFATSCRRSRTITLDRPAASVRRLVGLPAVTQREQARVTYRLHADRTSFTGVDLRRIVEPGEIRVAAPGPRAGTRNANNSDASQLTQWCRRAPSILAPHGHVPRGLLSAGAGDQADDRQFAVGRLLVAGEAGHGGGDLLPGLLALGPVELFGGDGDLAVGRLDPDLVGMGGEVVVPGRVPGRSDRRGDDQPGVVLAAVGSFHGARVPMGVAPGRRRGGRCGGG